MATVLGTLNVNVRANTGKFRKGMRDSRAITGQFKTSVIGLAAKLGTLAGAYIGVTRTISAFRSQFAAIDKIAKTSDKIGIATEALAGLQLAADLGGVSTGDDIRSAHRHGRLRMK